MGVMVIGQAQGHFFLLSNGYCRTDVNRLDFGSRSKRLNLCLVLFSAYSIIILGNKLKSLV